MTEIDKKKFIKAISLMEDVAGEFVGLTTDTIEKAKKLLRELRQDYLEFSRDSYDLVGLSSLYYRAKRDLLIPDVTFKDFIQKTPFSEAKIRRVYKKIRKVKKEKPIPRVKKLVRFIKEFGITGAFAHNTIDHAIKLAEEISEKRALIGRTSRAIVAACLYFAIHLPGERRNQDEICELCEVASSTLRDVLKQSFFVEKKSEYGIKRYGGFEPVDRRALFKLLSKLLLKIDQDQYEIPFTQIRSTLRRTYPVALRSYTIPTYRLRTAFKGLERKGLLFLIDGPQCLGKEYICKYCSKNTCRDSIIYLQRAAILKYPQSS